MVPEPALIDRFSRDLGALTPSDSRIGLAVSGGPDSLALLLLAAAARPGSVEAATVDHGLREGSRDEALLVAAICAELGVPHVILNVDWPDKPHSAIQERARDARYRLLAGWAQEREFDAVVTGHHADDQAETLLMRLNRGAGVRGLAGMRARATVPASAVPLLRPLLSWRRSELAQICASSGIRPVSDPSNSDERFERVRVRKALGDADWINAAAMTASAGHLAEADEALDWAAAAEWERAVRTEGDTLIYSPSNAPPEIVRRVVAKAIAALASEGPLEPLRARQLEPLLSALQSGGRTNLRGVTCTGGPLWTFSTSPARRRRTTS